MKYTLVLNSGSTSLKFKIFDKSFNQINFGVIEKIGQKKSIVQIADTKNEQQIMSHEIALTTISKSLEKSISENIDLIIHRIVHGGVEFDRPIVLNKNILKKISKYNDLAPLHNPINLKVAEFALSLWPKIKHVGAFDTMFFQCLPSVASLYPISTKYLKKYQIKKFGFHGFSHYGMLVEASIKLNKKTNECNLITCHLGGGSSIAVIKNGKPIDISMGFGPNSGLMMMTRSGDIDPTIIQYLYNKKENIENIYNELNFNSGLFGVSGFSDLRDIMILCGYKIPGYKLGAKPNSQNKKNAKLALDMFIYRIQRFISSYMTLLPNIDAIVFSGAIGERNQDIRNLILSNEYFKNFRPIIVNCDEEKNMAISVIK